MLITMLITCGFVVDWTTKLLESKLQERKSKGVRRILAATEQIQTPKRSYEQVINSYEQVINNLTLLKKRG